MPKKINVKLFDVDNCVYPVDPESPDFILIDDEHNRPFLEGEIAQAEAEGYQKIVLGYGTNRQDQKTDEQNGNRKKNGSCVRVLPELQAHFQEQLTDIQIVQDTFLMADIYGKDTITAGQSYLNMKAEHEEGSSISITHATAVFDHAKISLIYAHAHRIAAAENADDEIVIDFYDDLEGICQGIVTFYQTHPDLLPSNVLLRVKHHVYDSAQTRTYAEIQGTGITDDLYPWSVRWMGAVGETCEPPDFEENTLEEHHRTKTYPYQIAWGNSIGTDTFPIAEFKAFRSSQLSSLPREAHITHRGYSPAHPQQAPFKTKEIPSAVRDWGITSKSPQPAARYFTPRQKVIAASVLGAVLVGAGATLLFAGIIASPLTGGSSLIASGIGLWAFKIGMTLLASLAVATIAGLATHAVCKEKNTKPAASQNFFKPAQATTPATKVTRNSMDIHRPYKQGSVHGG